MEELRIIPYEQKHHLEYKRLSLEWLEKFDLYEEADGQMLENPNQMILEKGGYIFLADYENKIAGTITLKKVDESCFEILKLGVNSDYQGLGIGKKLMSYCIDLCTKQNVKKIILETNTKLEPAIALYRKFGFKEIALTDVMYDKSNFKMELDLSK